VELLGDNKQVRPSLGADFYPRMPILGVANPLYESASARATRMIKPPVQIAHPYIPYFGLLGSKVPQNERFPAQDADEPPCKI